MLVFSSSEAQLLKKLKDKAQDVLEPKNNSKTSGTSGETNGGNSGNSSTTTKEKWSPSPNDQKVFTIEPDETFLYDETRVLAKEGAISYAFITQNRKYQYFLVADGKKTGPFQEAPMNQLGGMKSEKMESVNDGKIELGPDKKDPLVQQYSKTIANKLYLVFNGKNFGPYDYVSKIIVSPDEKKFWAAVVIGGVNEMMSKMGMGNSFLVNESGIKQKAGSENSMGLQLLVSPEFKSAALSVMDNATQKILTTSSNGKVQEGSMAEMYSNEQTNLWVADNGDLVWVPNQSPRQLLVNGEEVAMFKVPITSVRRLFLHPDYKKSTYYDAGKLYRGDGTEENLSGVLFPKFVVLNGQRAIYYYKVYEPSQGIKDVYLCKKAL